MPVLENPVAARGCLRRWGKKLRSGEANGGESGERELSGKCVQIFLEISWLKK
jgi:hypothetical protein